MHWRELMRNAAGSTVYAVAVSALFGWFDAAPWPLSLAVLLFAGPLTDVLLELIASRNPSAGPVARFPSSSWRLRWIGALGWVVVVGAVALFISRRWGVAFRSAFAWTWLIVSGAGAVNAIAMEYEDNAPGGFLNPAPPKHAAGTDGRSGPPST